MPPARRPGIFCLEGEWEADLRKKRSVRPILEMLSNLELAQWIHRDVATRAEAEHYLRKWHEQRYKDFSILFLATHGSEGAVSLSDQELELSELGDLLEGSCEGKIVYFGSCGTLDVDDGELKRFVKSTGARAVIGYREDVDWVTTATFEVMLLQQLVQSSRSDKLFRDLVKEHGEYSARLGLVVAGRTKVYTA